MLYPAQMHLSSIPSTNSKLGGSFLHSDTALFVQDDWQYLATLVQACARQHYHITCSHVLPTTQLVAIQACTEALSQQFDMSHDSHPPTLVFSFHWHSPCFPLHSTSDQGWSQFLLGVGDVTAVMSKTFHFFIFPFKDIYIHLLT